MKQPIIWSLLIILQFVAARAGTRIPITFPSVGNEEIKGPNLTDVNCGIPSSLPIYFGGIGGKTLPIYYLNYTADRLLSQGFKITYKNMSHDAVSEFSYTNGTESGNLKFDGFAAILAVGGKPADRVRAYYMAQLGSKQGDTINWLCDGVLLNTEWVLSAAHCFTDSQATPNLIRLGDYDLSIPPSEADDAYGKFINDYEIEELIPHPLFKLKQRYYDLVLLRLPRKIPNFSSSINPICLPWDSRTNENLAGKELILTGWGATAFGGPKTSLLQQISLESFGAAKCNESYSQLKDFQRKYPKGINDDVILCVGWNEDGRDACGGDSGAPLVYDTKNMYGGYAEIILAGIVSGGYGCGLKQFPGLYIPVNKPDILRWIKEVAFKDDL